MTVTSGIARERFIGTGTTGPFSFNYRLYSQEHLTIVKTDVDGVDSDLVLTTDYTVTLASDFGSATINLVANLEGDGVDDGGSEVITVTRDPPIEQLTRWPRNDPFPSVTHERAADLAVMMIGRLNEKISRSLLLPESSALSGLQIPAPVAGAVLGWNVGATNLQNYQLADIGSAAFPPSTTDNEVPRFDGTDGLTLQGSGVTISDAGVIAGASALVLSGAAGVDVEPGSDADADLLTVGVTGAPRFRWDETNDRFAMTHGLDLGTSLRLGVGTIDLGHASDTTLSRSAAGEVAVEGNPLAQKNPNRTTQTGTSYSLAATDAGRIVTMNNGSANTLNIQTQASATYPANMIVEIKQLGAGVTTIQAPSGVTLNGVNNGSAAISNRYQSIGLFREADNTWIIDGAHEDVA